MSTQQHPSVGTSSVFGRRDDEYVESLLDGIDSTTTVLSAAGAPAFLTNRTLLGAVRDGALFSRESDVDVGYLAAASHPFDVILQSFRLERLFQTQGWETSRLSGGSFKLHLRTPDGIRVGIDVLAGWVTDGMLHMPPGIVAHLSTSAVVPPSTVLMEGKPFPAPADPVALLQAAYGSQWQDADAGEGARSDPRVSRCFDGWLRGESRHRTPWDSFYQMHADRVPGAPSAFARWVAQRETGTGSIIDVGCGTGRDTLFLARQGHKMTGLDYSRSAVEQSRALAHEARLDVRFAVMNLYNLRHVLAFGAWFVRDVRPTAVYARFLVDAVDDEGRANLLRFSRSVLSHSRGRLYLEFRIEPAPAGSTDRFRHAVQPDVVVAELLECGFLMEHREEKNGLAVHKGDDPRVCRIVARRGP